MGRRARGPRFIPIQPTIRGWRFKFMPNQPTISISGGRREYLGLAGGQLFLSEERNIIIDDVKIDLEERSIMFNGICYSVNESEGRKFKSVLRFFKYSDGILIKKGIKMRSVVFGEDVGHEIVTVRTEESGKDGGHGIVTTLPE